MASSSSSSGWNAIASFPSSKRAFTLSRRAASLAAVLSILACLPTLAILLSRISISEKISSRLMVSISRRGFMFPSTWTTLSSSKQRTTCTMASTSLMLLRNWLPRPSPLEAPFTRPAISTNSMTAGVTFLEWYISPRSFSLSSGTVTIPTLGSMVQKG